LDLGFLVENQPPKSETEIIRNKRQNLIEHFLDKANVETITDKNWKNFLFNIREFLEKIFGLVNTLQTLTTFYDEMSEKENEVGKTIRKWPRIHKSSIQKFANFHDEFMIKCFGTVENEVVAEPLEIPQIILDHYFGTKEFRDMFVKYINGIVADKLIERDDPILRSIQIEYMKYSKTDFLMDAGKPYDFIFKLDGLASVMLKHSERCNHSISETCEFLAISFQKFIRYFDVERIRTQRYIDSVVAWPRLKFDLPRPLFQANSGNKKYEIFFDCHGDILYKKKPFYLQLWSDRLYICKPQPNGDQKVIFECFRCAIDTQDVLTKGREKNIKLIIYQQIDNQNFYDMKPVTFEFEPIETNEANTDGMAQKLINISQWKMKLNRHVSRTTDNYIEYYAENKPHFKLLRQLTYSDGECLRQKGDEFIATKAILNKDQNGREEIGYEGFFADDETETLLKSTDLEDDKRALPAILDIKRAITRPDFQTFKALKL
jgi:hypothetical protein